MLTIQYLTHVLAGTEGPELDCYEVIALLLILENRQASTSFLMPYIQERFLLCDYTLSAFKGVGVANLSLF